MRTRSWFLTIGTIISLLVSVMAGVARPPTALAAPTSVTIAGDLDQALGCPNQWQADCAAAHLKSFDSSGVYWSNTWTVPQGSYNYKAALNDNWNVSYGQNTGSNNIPLNLPSNQPVTFLYDDNTHWVTDSVNSVVATLPGDFQTQVGCANNWDPACLESWLEDPTGTGTYSFTTTALKAGSYNVKVAVNLNWNENYGQGGVPGGANITFTVPADHAKVIFRYNPTSHVLTVLAGHGHDNNIEYDGLGHNSQDSLYRVPFGAVTPNAPVTLRFRTYHNDVTGVKVRLYDTSTGAETFVPMSIAASNVSCYDSSQPDERCDFWQAQVSASQPTTLYYRFIVQDGSATAYYADTNQELGGWGAATPTVVDNSYAITVYNPSFQVIPWMKDGIMYQIFPDRFSNGTGTNDPVSNGVDVIKKSWNQLPEGYCANYVNPATPCTQSPHGRDYYGGDLQGIINKLPYLHTLGVTTIYLNPIFLSGSDHGYDTKNYFQISPYFGTTSTFQLLAGLAHSFGMKVILDGVFNHMSSSSPFFDRYHQWPTVGACESVNSPYRSWFTFQDVAPGTGPCAGSAGPNSATYTSWFGFDSLAVLNKNNPAVQNYFYGDTNSVVRYWLRMGADGWRFDVMSDPSFPVSYWQGVRAAAKATKSDAVLICECWQKGDVLSRVSQGNQADSTMNYRFRNAILGFLGTVDNKGFPDDGASNEAPSFFAEKLLSIRQDNPDAAYYTLMNLLDSHDTQRILWSLTPGQNNREDKEFNAANVAQGKRLLTLARVIQMTTPGTPDIYYGDEVGLTGDTDPDDRRTFPWASQGGPYGQGGDQALYLQEAQLIALRKANAVFRDGGLHFLLTDDTNRTLAYLMRTPTSAGLVAMNRNSQPETLTINTQGWLPNNLTLTGAYGALSSANVVNGTLTIQLPAYGVAVLLPQAGQNLVAPAAVTGLTATAGNGQVTLHWPALGSNSYAVYRSPVSGGGYTWIGNTAGTSYVDTTAGNGHTYYYVVRAIDPSGLAGPNSNEASAFPSFPIGWGILQWPKTVTQPLSTAYITVYGRVYVAGLTDAGGDPAGVWAQVGYGSQGTAPSTWTWTDMTANTSCGGCGNNYEYQGNIRPIHTGTYNFLVRFSTDNGAHWSYGDQNGPGTATPGVLTLTQPSDTIPPAAPTGLNVTDWSPGSIALSWNPVSDAAEYWVYRRVSGGSYGDPVAVLSAPATTFTDTTVQSGATYFYVVKAVDSALNVSSPSNEVSHAAVARTINVTFKVTLPADTPAADTIHIAGNFPSPYPSWDPSALPMTRTDATHATITLQLLEGFNLQYKYTRGAWSSVEKGPNCEELSNRTLTVSPTSNGAQTESDTVAKWADVDHC